MVTTISQTQQLTQTGDHKKTLLEEIQEKGFKNYVEDIQEKERLRRIRMKVLSTLGLNETSLEERRKTIGAREYSALTQKINDMIVEEIKRQIAEDMQKKMEEDSRKGTVKTGNV